MGMVAQQKWLTKLLGYDFVIAYKKGKENKVANALSRQVEKEGSQEALLAMISFPTPRWVKELKESYRNSDEAKKLISSLYQGPDPPKGYLY